MNGGRERDVKEEEESDQRERERYPNRLCLVYRVSPVGQDLQTRQPNFLSSSSSFLPPYLSVVSSVPPKEREKAFFSNLAEKRMRWEARSQAVLTEQQRVSSSLRFTGFIQ